MPALTKIAHGPYGAIVFAVFDSRSGNRRRPYSKLRYQKNMRNIFKNIFRGKTVIVGIGNTMKGDDGLGPELVKRLNDKIKAFCIDAGVTPENHVGKIAAEKPDTVMLIDAAHLNKKPGAYGILDSRDISRSGLTTHDISPSMFIEYLKAQTGAAIFLLGVQPGDISFGARISERVAKAIDKIEKLIMEANNA